MERVTSISLQRLVGQTSPVLLAMLVSAVSDHVANDDPTWTGFAGQVSHSVLTLAPMLAGHLAAVHWRKWRALAAWLAGLALYPALVVMLAAGWALPVWQFALAATLSLVFLSLHPAVRAYRHKRSATQSPILRLPITLDITVAVMLALWALGATSLFASTPDAVRNQPLKVWLDLSQIASEPAEALGYLSQFGILALLLYGWYWLSRYALVRQVLRRQGVIPFAFSIAALIAIGTPIAASIGLLMPINIPEWTVMPSENHNPFDTNNYSFTIWLTVIVIPVILTFERLLAEQSASDTQHERVKAELHLLQQQINPHFLFNTLNTLYALCLTDRDKSAAAVVKLSDLLRYVVYRGQAERNELDDEIAYLKNYLDLQMLRFGHRCSLETKWPDGAGRFTLPPLLLIMLVENAFKHGVEPVEGACEVRIAMTVASERIEFECWNSLPNGKTASTSGAGLANLRRRLHLLFGPNYQLDAGAVDKLWRARLTMDLEPC